MFPQLLNSFMSSRRVVLLEAAKVGEIWTPALKSFRLSSQLFVFVGLVSYFHQVSVFSRHILRYSSNLIGFRADICILSYSKHGLI